LTPIGDAANIGAPWPSPRERPGGEAPEEVEKVIRDQQLGYATFLAPAKSGDARIGGYPAGVFPYGILVDARGRVAGHGSLSELLGKLGVEALMAPR
jgi:hypothetical protein